MPKEPSSPELDETTKALAEMLVEFDPDVAEEFGHWIHTAPWQFYIDLMVGLAGVIASAGETIAGVARSQPSWRSRDWPMCRPRGISLF